MKRLDVAKSRLVAFGDAERRRLALAFAQDVVAAALACPVVSAVLVVTVDRAVADAVLRLGAEVLEDRPDAGLNAALERGVDQLRTSAPDRSIATLSSDLPCVQARDLQLALRAADRAARTFVADTEGVGTTLLTARPGVRLDARYGPDSRTAHLASGAVQLRAAARLRRDVDTAEHLMSALLLGVGRHTQEAVHGPHGPGVGAGRAGVHPDGAR